MDSYVLLKAKQKKPCQAARYLAGAFRKLSGLGPSEGPVHISVPLCSFHLFCFQGFLWIPMDSYAFLWITIEFLWFPIDSYRILWIPMGSYVFLWIPIDS